MGHRVRIYASKKWQLSLTLGGQGADQAGDRVAEPEKPVGRMGPSLRIIWPDQAVQSDAVQREQLPEA
jgi:hypothetical protein